MPPYYYHLKFELYATPDPTGRVAKGRSTTERDNIWVPSPSSTIFDNLPSHPRGQQSTRPRWPSNSFQGEFDEFRNYRAKRHPAANSTIIDCGAHRGKTHDGGDADDSNNIVRLSERQYRARAEASPPADVLNTIGPLTAVRDWRFGRINIESFGLADETQDQNTGNMAGKEGFAPATPAASLGPSLPGIGQATKARYLPLETKNTEAGWGIVHLYREGDESETQPPLMETRETAVGEGSSLGKERDEEGTILCIPAVPSYMSPNDFLGFVGERWRNSVSHYRMVMMSTMSRYMVLMKFRDPRQAREWRKEFDGKPFDSMEVGYLVQHASGGGVLIRMGRPKFAMSRSSNRSRSRRRIRRATREKPQRPTTSGSRRHLPALSTTR